MRNVAGLLRSRGYADQVNEVRALGGRVSSVRTADQTAVAFFWANDVDGTYKPPGHLNVISQVVSAQKGLTLSETELELQRLGEPEARASNAAPAREPELDPGAGHRVHAAVDRDALSASRDESIDPRRA